jgi:hypothetical protein
MAIRPVMAWKNAREKFKFTYSVYMTLASVSGLEFRAQRQFQTGSRASATGANATSSSEDRE